MILLRFSRWAHRRISICLLVQNYWSVGMIWIVFLLLNAICLFNSPSVFLHIVLHRRVTANTEIESLAKLNIFLPCLYCTHLTECPSQSSLDCVDFSWELHERGLLGCEASVRESTKKLCTGWRVVSNWPVWHTTALHVLNIIRISLLVISIMKSAGVCFFIGCLKFSMGAHQLACAVSTITWTKCFICKLLRMSSCCFLDVVWVVSP